MKFLAFGHSAHYRDDEGKERFTSWAEIHRLALTDPAYADLLKQARKEINHNVVTVTVRNISGDQQDYGSYTWACVILDMTGTVVHMPNTLGSDYGQTGRRSEAIAEAKKAYATLVKQRYQVTWDVYGARP